MNETGSFAPHPLNNGAKPKITKEDKEAMRAKILEQPDITLGEFYNKPLDVFNKHCYNTIKFVINN